eukprot:Em0015g677a
MKSLACGETGILLKLDIMEGKEANQRKDFAQLYDSAFSSVKTLLALQERGLHFMGMVKTAHKEYPLAYLKPWALGHESEKEPVRGEFCLLEAEVENGMCIVKAYLAYKFEVEKAYGSPDHFRDFIGKLAYELINNVFQIDSITLRDIPSVQVETQHIPIPLSSLPMKQNDIVFTALSPNGEKVTVSEGSADSLNPVDMLSELVPESLSPVESLPVSLSMSLLTAVSHRQRKSATQTTATIVDLDESYIHHYYRHHNDSLFDPNDPDCSQPRTQKKGKRFCFVAAIRKSNSLTCQAPIYSTISVNDKASLIPNLVWIFLSQRSSGDYHQNFNGANFVHWFKIQLLSNLSEPCLIRLNNAKYHPASIPSAYKLKKAQLQEVLTASGIQFGAKDTVATLRQRLCIEATTLLLATCLSLKANLPPSDMSDSEGDNPPSSNMSDSEEANLPPSDMSDSDLEEAETVLPPSHNRGAKTVTVLPPPDKYGEGASELKSYVTTATTSDDGAEKCIVCELGEDEDEEVEV